MTVTSKPLANMWWLLLLQGITTLILGVLLVTAPGMTTAVLVTLLGIYWLVGGIFSIVGIFVGDTGVPWGWLLLNGILGILAGLAVLNHPLWSAILLPAVLAIFIAIEGIIMGVVGLIQAFQGGGWGAGIWGVVSIIIGIALLGRPLVAASVLPIVMGILAVVGGIVLIVLAFRVRSAYKAAMA